MDEKQITKLLVELGLKFPESYITIDTDRHCKAGNVTKIWWLNISNVFRDNFETWEELLKEAYWHLEADLEPDIGIPEVLKSESFSYPRNRISEY